VSFLLLGRCADQAPSEMTFTPLLDASLLSPKPSLGYSPHIVVYLGLSIVTIIPPHRAILQDLETVLAIQERRITKAQVCGVRKILNELGGDTESTLDERSEHFVHIMHLLFTWHDILYVQGDMDGEETL
jgi:hypothetical protein